MPESEQFRAIATAMLDRRIRNMRRLDEKTWIDTSLITHAEYQLFLDEMYTREKFHQPDHWKEKRFLPDEARTPVVGIRPSDALTFCKWLGEQGDGRFRLPFEKETLELEDTLPGFWQFTHKGEFKTKYKGERPTLDYASILVLANQPDLKQIFDFALDKTNDIQSFLDVDLVFLNHNFRDPRAYGLDKDFTKTLVLALARNHNISRKSNLSRACDLARVLAQSFTEYKSEFQKVTLSLLILSLRREGLLPAFEGILIVREEPDHA